jgi:hypothetical protein
MTSIEVTAIEVTAVEDLYLNGSSDAAMGISPQSKEPRYLDGYLVAMREGIEQGTYTLQIRWLSESFLRRAYD